MPANLLADDSVLNRAVNVLTAEVCADVEVIGWLYQFYISERKDEVFAGFKKNKKAGAAEIPAATQLFTPHWIVRYLVENSLGRLWMLNHPDSQLVEQMDYYIPPVDAETDFLIISSPEDIKIIDPACGSGHMLTYAFDLLYAIYQEEGYAPSQIPELILTHNLYGTEIDPRAGTLAAFALTMKATAKRKLFLKNPVQPNICVIEPISFTDDELDYLLTAHGDRSDEETFWNQFRNADLLGSLIQPDPQLTTQLTHHLENLDYGDDLLNADTLQRARHVITQAQYLQPRYTVAVANPPYMGSGNMNDGLSAYARRRFPDSGSDLFAMFIERCWTLALEGGTIGMITMQSWMFLPTFSSLRERLGPQSTMLSLVHLGSGAFDTVGGEVVSTVAWVWCRLAHPGVSAPFIDLTDVEGESGMATAFRQSLPTAIHSNPRHSRQNTPAGTERLHIHSLNDFLAVPGRAFAYQLTSDEFAAFQSARRLSDVLELREGINTGDNERFLRRWWEVSRGRTSIGRAKPTSPEHKWVPLKKGGPFRKWAGNEQYVVDWSDDGAAIRSSPRARPQNTQYFFRPSVSWSRVAGNNFSLRAYGEGFGFDSTGPSAFGAPSALRFALAFLNSALAERFLRAISPTLDFRLRNMGNLPVPGDFEKFEASHVDELVKIARTDWNEQEVSWDYTRSPLLNSTHSDLSVAHGTLRAEWAARTQQAVGLETLNNRRMAAAYSLPQWGGVAKSARLALFCNPEFRYGSGLPDDEYAILASRDDTCDLVSYAVGCMFGRYSLDVPGLVLADQGATVQDYLEKVPEPRFMPDVDNVLPIVDGDWFEDDIVARFRQFLRMAFGEQHFEENLRFVTEALGVNDIRDYFVKSFYKDHVQRYKKRPIYWMFSSPKGSFNALIYMHRYSPTTVSTVLNEYLREFQAKVTASLDNAQRSNNAKEADRLRKILLELQEYEHDVLYPLATQQIHIDLDDGVKTNYPKLGKALKKIPGLETTQ